MYTRKEKRSVTMLRVAYWLDNNGKTRLVTQQGTGSLSALQAALLAKSNAGVYQFVEGTLQTLTPVVSPSQYPSVNDVAVLTYTDGSGSLVNVLVPGPVSSLFLADQETVDSTQLSAIDSSVIGTVLTPAGGVVTAYVSGVRKPTGRTL